MTNRKHLCIIVNAVAGVAELADAHVWGACGFTVRVQFPSPAPTKRGFPTGNPLFVFVGAVEPARTTHFCSPFYHSQQPHFVCTQARVRIGCTSSVKPWGACSSEVSVKIFAKGEIPVLFRKSSFCFLGSGWIRFFNLLHWFHFMQFSIIIFHYFLFTTCKSQKMWYNNIAKQI